MSDRLLRALEASRGEIEAAVREAEDELAALATRREELEGLIARGNAALGSESPGRQMTLHEAMKTILEERDDRSMNVRDLAAEVNRRGLYRKRDGSPVEVNQIHARAKNYDKLFDKDGPRVRLLEGEAS
jgi:hypothetical protein